MYGYLAGYSPDPHDRVPELGCHEGLCSRLRPDYLISRSICIHFDFSSYSRVAPSWESSGLTSRNKSKACVNRGQVTRLPPGFPRLLACLLISASARRLANQPTGRSIDVALLPSIYFEFNTESTYLQSDYFGQRTYILTQMPPRRAKHLPGPYEHQMCTVIINSCRLTVAANFNFNKFQRSYCDLFAIIHADPFFLTSIMTSPVKSGKDKDKEELDASTDQPMSSPNTSLVPLSRTGIYRLLTGSPRDLGSNDVSTKRQLVVTAAERADSKIAVRCSRAGCETDWYHLSCLGHPRVTKTWMRVDDRGTTQSCVIQFAADSGSTIRGRTADAAPVLVFMRNTSSFPIPSGILPTLRCTSLHASFVVVLCIMLTVHIRSGAIPSIMMGAKRIRLKMMDGIAPRTSGAFGTVLPPMASHPFCSSRLPRFRPNGWFHSLLDIPG
ncbi:hypothetical protein B0H11DRAFT_2208058 [Mycena galericulata]|nr:hypothetical protein B0H11DRAFT_2208058 [Mycena galericulata]